MKKTGDRFWEILWGLVAANILGWGAVLVWKLAEALLLG
jgi:hypothetical protein